MCRRRRDYAPWIVLTLYLTLSFLLFRAVWSAPDRLTPGTSADTGQFMWFLGWASYALGHHTTPFFTTYLDYPYGVNLMWNTSVLLPGAVLAPLTAHVGPVVAENLLVTISLPLSGWCAFLGLRRFVASDIAAAAGGPFTAFRPI